MTERNHGQKTVGGPTVVPTQAEPQLDLPPAQLVADEALIVRPGDHLIVRFAQYVDEHEAQKFKLAAMEKLPGLGGVVVIGLAEQIAVYRPDRFELRPAGD